MSRRLIAFSVMMALELPLLGWAGADDIQVHNTDLARAIERGDAIATEKLLDQGMLLVEYSAAQENSRLSGMWRWVTSALVQQEQLPVRQSTLNEGFHCAIMHGHKNIMGLFLVRGADPLKEHFAYYDADKKALVGASLLQERQKITNQKKKLAANLFLWRLKNSDGAFPFYRDIANIVAEKCYENESKQLDLSYAKWLELMR